MGKGAVSLSTSAIFGQAYGSHIFRRLANRSLVFRAKKEQTCFDQAYFARPEGETRVHNRLGKHGFGMGDPVRYLQIPVLDPDTEEMSLTSWPFLLPTDFAGNFEHYKFDICEVLCSKPLPVWS